MPSTEFERLIIENLELVDNIARGKKSRCPDFVEYDDLVQEGRLGLIDAAKKWNGKIPFRPYAIFKIQYALMDGLRNGDIASKRFRKQKSIIDNLFNTRSELNIDSISEKLGVSRERALKIVDEVSRLDTDRRDPEIRKRNESELPDNESKTQEKNLAEKEKKEIIRKAVSQLSEQSKSYLDLFFLKNITREETRKILGIGHDKFKRLMSTSKIELKNKLNEFGIKSVQDFYIAN